MRDFEDMSGAGSGDPHQSSCRDEDTASGMGAPPGRHEARRRRVLPSAADFDVRYHARRSDRPWANRACRLPSWRAAAHGRGLA